MSTGAPAADSRRCDSGAGVGAGERIRTLGGSAVLETLRESVGWLLEERCSDWTLWLL